MEDRVLLDDQVGEGTTAATSVWTDADLRRLVSRGQAIVLDRDTNMVELPHWLRPLRRVKDDDWAYQATRLAVEHPADRMGTVRAFMTALEHPGMLIENRSRRQLDGVWHSALVSRVNLLHDPRVRGILVILTDLGPIPDPPMPKAIDGIDLEAPAWVTARLDTIGMIIDIEGMVDAVFGRTPAELVDRSAIDLWHPDFHDEIVAMWMKAIAEPDAMLTFQARVNRPLADSVWAECTVVNRIPQDGTVLVVIHDITERRTQQAALRASQAEFRTLAEKVPAAVFRLDAHGKVTFGNQCWHRLAQLDTTTEPRLIDVFHEDEHDGARQLLAAIAAGQNEGSFEGRDRTGKRVLVVTLSAVDQAGATTAAIIGALEEVTSTAALRHQAQHDGLTGVLNRSALDQHLTVALTTSPEDIVVLFIDLDGFKAINDNYGHDVGDHVLRSVASQLRATVRPDDLVARYGGDEFVVVCRGVADHAVKHLLHRIEEAISHTVAWDGGTWVPHATIGMARGKDGEASPALLSRADIQMLNRKPSGSRRRAAR
jgi:diguanylate cyclase (GGDEF)-like protein/PAS domain S-box-containing protein